jgi:hypothetical protein
MADTLPKFWSNIQWGIHEKFQKEASLKYKTLDKKLTWLT